MDDFENFNEPKRKRSVLGFVFGLIFNTVALIFGFIIGFILASKASNRR